MQSNPVTLNELLAAQYFAIGGSMDAIGSKFVKPHLPEPKTADDILSEIEKRQDGLPITQAGNELSRLSLRVCRFIHLLQETHPDEAAGFAAYLSDALGDSVAQQRFNDETKTAEAAEEDNRNIWEVA